jgi:spore photoproduct lyase
MVIHANLEDMADELEKFFREDPDRRLRVGTGDCVDALELEPLTGYASDLVRIFSRWPNATLELKTQSDYVDELIALDPGNTVISWPVNPPDLLLASERHTAPLEKRIEAAARVAEAGYHVGFHFDPMVHAPAVI